jgi:ferredoxin
MAMLLTTIGFFALTGLFMWRHLRGPKQSAATLAGPPKPCPRCTASVPAGSAFCPGCGVPQQIFEVVAAPAASGAPNESQAAVRGIVRSDMCVGCGTCAAACPEPGAIALRGKLAVIDPALCTGHGECAKACPVGAISMSAGGGLNRVAVPSVDGNFETNVPGLYIVGELGGRG